MRDLLIPIEPQSTLTSREKPNLAVFQRVKISLALLPPLSTMPPLKFPLTSLNKDFSFMYSPPHQAAILLGNRKKMKEV